MFCSVLQLQCVGVRRRICLLLRLHRLNAVSPYFLLVSWGKTLNKEEHTQPIFFKPRAFIALVNINIKKKTNLEKVHPSLGRIWYYWSYPGAVFFIIFQIPGFLSFLRTQVLKVPDKNILIYILEKYLNCYIVQFTAPKIQMQILLQVKCFTDQLGFECLCYKIITRIDDYVSSKLFSVKSKYTFKTNNFSP